MLFYFQTTNSDILGLLAFSAIYSYGDFFQMSYLLQNRYFILNATISVPGWNIDCETGVWRQGARDYAGHKCSNWYGWTSFASNPNASIGSISTTFNGIGRAQLDFGNCWSGGTVNATLNGTLIASVPKNTPSVTVEFDFEIGSILKIAEHYLFQDGIIQFNSLNIIQCNGENDDGKYFL